LKALAYPEYTQTAEPIRGKPLIVRPNHTEASVSVVVPVYNAEDHLVECLDALLAQTCPSLEIIAVDDGSTDSSGALLDACALKHPERMAVLHLENGGVWRARKAGIQAASGEYIGFCDSDDIPSPSMYETLLARAKETAADMVVCAYQRVDAQGKKASTAEMTRFGNAVVDVGEDPGVLPLINTANWNKLFRADLIRLAADLEDAPRVAEDMVLQLSLYPFCKTIAFVDTPLYHYRVYRGSSMSTTRFADLEALRSSMVQMRCLLQELAADERLLSVCDLMAFLHLGVSLPLRLAPDAQRPFGASMTFVRHALDEGFPLYKKNRLCSLRSNLAHKGRALMPMLALWCYRLHLATPLFALYRFVTGKLGLGVRW
jgi:hypothetical protein